MSAESKAVVERYYDTLRRGEIDGLDDMVAESFVGHAGAGADRRQLKGELAAFVKAFPDLTIELDHVVAEDDKVSVWATYRGTHKGEFAGVPPSGRPIDIAGWDMIRVDGDRIVEMSSYCNLLGLLTQIGALPERVPA
jgi:steroid delta-isomerase-like uncharacterized protein